MVARKALRISTGAPIRMVSIAKMITYFSLMENMAYAMTFSSHQVKKDITRKNSKILLVFHIWIFLNHHTILSFLIHMNIVFFSENGCQEHYEPAGDICIRASIFPETYENAQKRCENDGGYLLSITSQKIQVFYNNITCSRERIKFFDFNIFFFFSISSSLSTTGWCTTDHR